MQNNKYRNSADDVNRAPLPGHRQLMSMGGAETSGSMAAFELLIMGHKPAQSGNRPLTGGSVGGSLSMLSGGSNSILGGSAAGGTPNSLFSQHQAQSPQHISHQGPALHHYHGSPQQMSHHHHGHNMHSHMSDMYRPDQSSSFPSSPYNPTVNLFMKPDMRQSLVAPTQQPGANNRQTTTVSSSKFSQYVTIYNLEQEPKPCSIVPKVKTQMYQTTARFAGKDIVLRRLVDAPVSAEDCATVFNRLRHFRHPNLVPLTGILSTDEFVLGSTDVIMEYKYIRGARSLQDMFFTDGARATEGLLWSMVCQLVGLIRAFHEATTSLRGLHFSKILYHEQSGRFYFSGLGLVDLMDPKQTDLLTHNARMDIRSLGFILLQLATGSTQAVPDQILTLRQMGCYSESFCQLVLTCLEASVEVAKLCHALGERLSMEVGHQEGHADYFLSQCSKEIHNGRLMRLMIKLNIVLEACRDVADYAQYPDRYAVKLFSQYVFNQVDEQNRVRLDWGHIFHSLNKLDSRSDDLIQLISNEGASTVLVTSFRDIGDLLNAIFDQLRSAGPEFDSPFSPMQPGSPGSL